MRTKSMALLCLLSATVLLAGACTKPKGAVNTPPTAVVVADPLHGAAPHGVDFSGLLSSDVGGSIVSYDWDFGDTNSDTGAEVTHSFAAEGDYTVTLTVTDDKGATGTETTDITVGGQSVPTLGCHDAGASVVYLGPIGTYKNAHLASNTTGCGSDPLNLYFTLVTATSQAEALTVCGAGPDPAADTAVNLNALGWTTIGTDVWSCNNPASDELIVPGSCHVLNGLSVQYNGPRNTLENAELYGAAADCTGAVDSTWTYVQHSTEAAALAECTAIDPTFNTASTLVGLFPTMPDDLYVCSIA